jgi:hypothetical protein
MAKVTKWRPNTIPHIKNPTLFGHKQRIEGKIVQTA